MTTYLSSTELWSMVSGEFWSCWVLAIVSLVAIGYGLVLMGREAERRSTRK